MVTVHWFYEDFRRAGYWRDVLPGYDHFCAIQRGPLPAACAEAGAAYHFLPTACPVEALAAIDGPRRYDVAFVGFPSQYRIAFLERLARQGFTIACGGEGWQSYKGILENSIVNNRWVSEAESFHLLAQSKIGINLSFDDPASGRDHLQASPRVYETLAAGALLVTEESPLLQDSLAGCVFSAFRSAEEAVAVITELLGRYDSLRSTIEENRKTVLGRHTFTCRAQALLSLA